MKFIRLVIIICFLEIFTHAIRMIAIARMVKSNSFQTFVSMNPLRIFADEIDSFELIVQRKVNISWCIYDALKTIQRNLWSFIWISWNSWFEIIYIEGIWNLPLLISVVYIAFTYRFIFLCAILKNTEQ